MNSNMLKGMLVVTTVLTAYLIYDKMKTAKAIKAAGVEMQVDAAKKAA